MNIFLTGATGFVGRSVARICDNHGYTILAITRQPKDLLQDFKYRNLSWIHGDLKLESEFFSQLENYKPDVVVDLAWDNIPNFCFDNSFENLRSHQYFYSKILQIPSVKKIIVSGSCYEYSNQGECVESAGLVSANYFTWAKSSLSKYLQIECAKNNLEFIWLRIFYAYGPYQRKQSLIPSIISSLQSGELPQIKNPFNKNDFIYVDDIGECIKLVIEKNLESGIYNLGSGYPIQIIEILRLIEDILGVGSEASERIFNNTCVNDSPSSFWANMNKTKSALNWLPQTSIESGIRQTLGRG